MRENKGAKTSATSLGFALTRVLSLRTTPAEADLIEAAATARGQTVSGFARELLLRAAAYIERDDQ